MKIINRMNTLRNNQQGFAAFFVTIMVMVIFGILIFSFSQISNREGTNSLNRVLSNQALYAAESGINDAYSAIRADNSKGIPAPQQTNTCSGTNYSSSNVGNAKYTCILVNTSPQNLEFQCPTYCPNNSIIAHIQSLSSTNPISSLSINWSDSTRTDNSCGSSNLFPQYTTWISTNCFELLRVDLVPFQSGTTLTSLESGVRTFFLYPSSRLSASTSYISLPAMKGPVYSAACSNSTFSCSFTITGLNTVSGDSSGTYYVRVQYYYGTPSNISFNGLSTSNTPVSFSDAQILIDANGLSDTVSKRIGAYINPLGNGASYSLPLPPNYAIQSTSSICKSLVVDNSSGYLYNVPADTTNPYSALNYQLTPVPSYSIPYPPAGAGVPSVSPPPNSIPPTLVAQNELTADSSDPCNPI